MKICSVVIAAWVCWVLMVGTGRVCSFPAAGLMLSESDDVADKGRLDKGQPTRLGRFSLNSGTTDDEYKNFIEGLITNSLADPNANKANLIKRLPARWLTVNDDGNSIYGLLELENTDISNCVVTLVISMNDLYLLGFHSSPAATNNAYYYFTDRAEAPGAGSLFSGATSVSLRYDGSYSGGLSGRKTVSLGSQQLLAAIKTLYQRQGDRNDWKTSLLVVVQMMLESIRFGVVLDNLVENWYLFPKPTALMIEVQNEWGTLSDSYRKALDKDNNVFIPAITLANWDTKIERISENKDDFSRRLVTLMGKPNPRAPPPPPPVHQLIDDHKAHHNYLAALALT
ncbi:hypothetical protein Tsubulata_011483 [Turnera subulata]|uniref:rRNA N-glycosylase n=1 Tax=Turnera subulata TaxID=218843 RepID=A0A9Q0GI33_9ROSI|nr:hypothetical protein Tsubulata_011483 [Turnera subulata]